MVGASPTLVIHLRSDSLSSERFGLLSRRGKTPTGVRVPLGAPILLSSIRLVAMAFRLGRNYRGCESLMLDHFSGV